jgi:lysophospholipase L1-like esterase
MSRALVAFLLAVPLAQGATPQTAFKFDFGPGKVAPGYLQVLSTTTYTKKLGYGFDLGSTVTCLDRSGRDALRGDFCTSDKPFFFSVDLPEGNYTVKVTLGDRAAETMTTIKAESHRLMLEEVRTAPGKFATRTFTVNIRTPKIAAGGEVHLKPRELGVLHWDDKLTLEFGNPRPCVCALEVAPAAKAITVYLMGDSTVTDQTREPWNSWGQMLPRFFKPDVAVANHAESGESLKSSLGERRLEKVMSTIRAGDYLFIQFGHNDQKEKGEGIGPFTSYRADLKRYVVEARKRGAIPVVVTSMHRRTFDAEGKITNSLGDYPEAVRQVAREEKVALIDLNAMSKLFYEALRPEESKKAFVDNTHHNSYGSYELAKCIVEGIKANKLGLARFVVDDFRSFDTSRPDPVASFKVPPSPPIAGMGPEGK